jgi:hypothetical protein
MKHPTMPLPEILAVLESIAAALRSADALRVALLQQQASNALRARSLDCGDRMILDKVLGRIRRTVGGLAIAQHVESLIAA